MSTARTLGIIGGIGLLGLLLATGAKAADREVIEPPPPKPSPGPSGGTASRKVWRERQTALAYLSGLEVCDCHPRDIDGKYGSETIRAVEAFQKFAGIDQDGKWGTATDSAMKRTLAEAASGTLPPTPDSGWGDKGAVCMVEVTGGNHDDQHDGLGNIPAIRLTTDIRTRAKGEKEYVTDQAWSIMGNHSHVVTLTTEQRKRLSQGKDVFVSAGMERVKPEIIDHAHQVHIRCSAS